MPETPSPEPTLPPGLFPVRHSILSPPDLLATVAREYAIGGLRACTLIRSGLNDTYLVQSADADYVLRVYRAGWRDLPDIRWELALLVHLAGRGIAVSSPVARRDGALLSAVRAPEGTRYVVLFTYATGELLRWDSTDGLWRSFLDGYTEIRGVGRDDREAVPLFTAARLVWSMGVQADGAEKWGLHRLDQGFWDSRLSFLRRWESAPLPV